jgi:hypothetical protein
VTRWVSFSSETNIFFFKKAISDSTNVLLRHLIYRPSYFQRCQFFQMVKSRSIQYREIRDIIREGKWEKCSRVYFWQNWQIAIKTHCKVSLGFPLFSFSCTILYKNEMSILCVTAYGDFLSLITYIFVKLADTICI